MTLMNAPVFDAKKQKRRNFILFGSIALFFALVIIFFAGYFLGHGYFFSDLPAEWRVSSFFTALEKGDFAKAYGIKMADPNWQQHPDKFKDYTFNEFKEDWTTGASYLPIKSHHVDISKRVGEGKGASIVVMVRPNGMTKDQMKDHPLSVCVSVSDKTLVDCPIGLSY
jgi:hypothetical protein